MGYRADSSGYGVGDVVKLEIEEDVEAAVAELVDERCSGGVEEFHADFEPLAGLFEAIDQSESLGGVGKIESDG
jgi:hypothetical protein